MGAGYRVIAPDLVGFGKSDKPSDPGAHTCQAHVDWMTGFVRELGTQHAAAFMQDWGGRLSGDGRDFRKGQVLGRSFSESA